MQAEQTCVFQTSKSKLLFYLSYSIIIVYLDFYKLPTLNVVIIDRPTTISTTLITNHRLISSSSWEWTLWFRDWIKKERKTTWSTSNNNLEQLPTKGSLCHHRRCRRRRQTKINIVFGSLRKCSFTLFVVFQQYIRFSKICEFYFIYR